MRSLHALLLGSLLLAQTGQRVKAAFGVIEGTRALGAGLGGFYSLIREPSGAQTTMLGPLYYNGRPLEPFGNDLAYDPRTKHLFLIGGSLDLSSGYSGIIYGMDVWRSQSLDSLTRRIGARRLAVKDTLLLVTRNRPPFFTAYRIRPTNTGVALDSLWSPSSAYLRSIPDAIIVVGDTAFIPLTYNPSTLASDSLILSINLRTQRVDSFAKVYPNPAELVRIGGKLYAACYADFRVPLHISEIDISSRAVTITNTGVNSSGGFVTDTGGRDTILFVDITAKALRAYSTTTRQVAPDPYQGIQGIGGLNLYGLLWAGDWLITAHTNYTDTLIVTFKERGRQATPLDTIRTGIPSLRRLIYVEEDAIGLELARANQIPASVQVYPNPILDRFWLSGEGIQQVTLRDLYGRVLYTWEAHPAEYALPNIPQGLYLLQVQTRRGLHTLRLQKL